MAKAVLYCSAVLVLLVILIAVMIWSGRKKGKDGFLIYPYLDLWDQKDVGNRGIYYGLSECRLNRYPDETFKWHGSVYNC